MSNWTTVRKRPLVVTEVLKDELQVQIRMYMGRSWPKAKAAERQEMLLNMAAELEQVAEEMREEALNGDLG